MEEECDEVIDKLFDDKFFQSVQDLAARKVANELSADFAPCEIRQGDELGISAIGELARSKDNFAKNGFPDGSNLMSKLNNMVKHFEANTTNKKLW